LNAELLSKRGRLVAARIIDQNLDVGRFGQPADTLLEGSRGVVGRHDHCDPYSTSRTTDFACARSFANSSVVHGEIL
jgi:hypothetical protein